jgi:hypothetical protein
MMKSHMRMLASAALALLLTFQASYAGTIIKLDLSGVGLADVEYSGGPTGVYSTMDDGVAGTTGEQNTSILYTGFLSSNPATTGSYTLGGATASGPAVVTGTDITQNLSGGSFQLYDSTNTLLLNVNLGLSQIHGNMNSEMGAEFSITNGTVVGGTLAPQLVANSIGTSMTLSDISSGGLSVGGGGYLNAFFADATKIITAQQIPEPAAIFLALCGASVAMIRPRRS